MGGDEGGGGAGEAALTFAQKARAVLSVLVVPLPVVQLIVGGAITLFRVLFGDFVSLISLLLLLLLCLSLLLCLLLLPAPPPAPASFPSFVLTILFPGAVLL
jgi:hypothetical protein